MLPVAMISVIGVYSATFSIFQMWMSLTIGVFAYVLRTFGYPIVPMLMGIILGPYLEEYLRRALIVADGDPLIFFASPFSAAFLVLTVVFVWMLRLRPYIDGS